MLGRVLARERPAGEPRCGQCHSTCHCRWPTGQRGGPVAMQAGHRVGCQRRLLAACAFSSAAVTRRDTEGRFSVEASAPSLLDSLMRSLTGRPSTAANRWANVSASSSESSSFTDQSGGRVRDGVLDDVFVHEAVPRQDLTQDVCERRRLGQVDGRAAAGRRVAALRIGVGVDGVLIGVLARQLRSTLTPQTTR